MPSNNPNATDNLVRFTPETASAAGRKSAALRKQRRDAANAYATGNAQAAHQSLTEALNTYQRQDLGNTAFAAAQHIIGRLCNGDVPIRHAGDAADLLRALVDIGRLEHGEATSLSVTFNAADVAERITRLRTEAEQDGGSNAASANTPTAAEPIDTTGQPETETQAPHPTP